MEAFKTELTESDLEHLKQCLTLAEASLIAGDEPFGSVLVNDKNAVIATARNQVNTDNVLHHPEIELAEWAAKNLTPEERKRTTMYTTGEHCPMCAAAHGWVGLGPIVYLSSAKQLGEWLKEFDAAKPSIEFIPVQKIIPGIQIKGPATQLEDRIKELHKKYYQKMSKNK